MSTSSITEDPKSTTLTTLTHPKRSLAFWLLVCVLLSVVTVVEVASVVGESQTHDEAVHIAAGYSYWKTGDFRLNMEHPPFSKLLSTIPLLWLGPRFSPPADAWRRADEFEIGKDFLYHNSVPTETLLLASRLVIVLLSIVLAVSLGWWVALRAGPAAGIVSLVLFSFEPTVLAHSRYVTSDLPVSLFMWLACISWCGYLEKPTGWAVGRTGLLTGLAVATKFNAMSLPVIFMMTWLMYRRVTPSARRSTTMRGGAMLTLISLFVVAASYAFETRSIAEDPVLALRLAKAYPDDGSTRSAIVQAVLKTPIPAYPLFRGLHILIRHNQSGHLTYLLGSISERGTWKYFPIALMVKTPVAWLVLLAVAIIHAARRDLQQSLAPGEQWCLISLLVPVAAYFAISLFSSINIGIRHLLPIYPFICAFIASVLFSKKQEIVIRILSWSLVLVFALESSAAYPNYLSYFNLAAGGSRNGYRVLLDSNLDWGQDLKRLKTYVETHNVEPLCLSYFGTADISHYGIHYQPLRVVRNPAELAELNCVVAISAEHLFGESRRPFEGLRSIAPTDRVGDSIFIYDLRRNTSEVHR